MPSPTSAGSRSTPFSRTVCTRSVIASTVVVAPALARNRSVVVEPKVCEPRVRSRSISVSIPSMSAARSSASARVRFSDGMRILSSSSK